MTDTIEAPTIAQAEQALQEVAEAVLDGTAGAAELIAAERTLEDAQAIAARAADIARQRANAEREATALAQAERLAATIAELVGDPATDELTLATRAAVDAVTNLWRVAEARAVKAAAIYSAAEGLATGRFDVPIRADLVPGGGRVVWATSGALPLIPADSIVFGALADVLPTEHLDPEANAVLAHHSDRVRRIGAAAASRPPLTRESEAKVAQNMRSQQERRRIARKQAGLKQQHLGQLRAIDTAERARAAGQKLDEHVPTRAEWLDKHPGALDLFDMTATQFLKATLDALAGKAG